jgi:Putative prokaryotic signal transducing protein
MSSPGLYVVYSGNIVQADFLKSVLEGEGINAILEDQFTGTIAPYAASAGGAGAVKVLVALADVDQARPIVEYFLNTAEE